MYYDYAATTPIRDEVKQRVIEVMDKYGNPSSSYELGNVTRDIISKTRLNVMKFIHADIEKYDVIFTSSGSASNTLAVTKIVGDYKIYYSPTSHKSMRLACESIEDSEKIKVEFDGSFNIDLLHESIELSGKKPLICIECANSETGIIHDVKELSKLAHRYGGYIIGDFTGYIPTIEVNIENLGVDIAIFSAHKLGALKGTGVICKRKEIEFLPIIYGSQEMGIFGGTENVIGIAALDIAISTYDYSCFSKYNRDYVYNWLINNISGCFSIGTMSNRLCNNLYMCFSGTDSASLVTLLDLENIQVSTGSACNNHDLKPSITLVEMKVKEQYINSCIRITFNCQETNGELDYLCDKIKKSVEILRM